MPSEKIWIMIGVRGAYIGMWFTRGDAIRAHTQALGRSWAECKAKGDSAARATITWED